MNRTFNPCDECRYGKERRDGSGNDSTCQICEFRTALRRTAEDDKAREEGRLVELPCAKSGAALYFIDKQQGEIYKEAYTNGLGLYWTNDSDIGDYLPLSCIGKTVFLTPAEAAAALGGGEGG